MLPQAGRYLDLVHQGRNEGWRYALGAVVILVSWIVVGWVPYAWISAQGEGGALLEFVAINSSILTMFAGLAVTVKLIHRRALMTLVADGTTIDWGRIARAALVWAIIGSIAAFVEHLIFPERYVLTFRAERFLAFAAVALVLTPLQAATEELVFRGYVMQGLGLVMKRPAAIAIASAVLFTFPHLLNPEVERYGLLMMGATYFAIGLALAVVVLRDGRLELAVGLHAANNLLLVLVANYEDSVLPSESIFTARELDPVYMLTTLVIGSLAFYGWFFLRGEGRSPTA